MPDLVRRQNDGLANENNISAAIDSKTLSCITPVLRSFIKDIDETVQEESVIKSEALRGQLKPDISITTSTTNTKYISIKTGNNNSVHQETINLFLLYAEEELGMNDEERESFLLYLYGDGTTDGNTTPDKWMTEEQVRECYPAQIEIIQNFINKNRRALLERFLIYGRLGKLRNIFADFLYHGTPNEGDWCKLNDATIDYLIQLPDVQKPSIGPFNIKSWGRGNARNRSSIQVMWNSCRNDLINIRANLIDKSEISEPDLSTNSHIIGSNTHGFSNQSDIVTALNGQRYRNLPLHLKAVIKEMYPSIANSEIIYASKRERCQILKIKNCIEIVVNGVTKSIAVHYTGGISGHQEPLSSFIDYCTNTLDMTEEEKNTYLFLHYGDGTTDGSGKVEDRLNNTELRNNYPEKIQKVQRFLDRNKRDLLERILLYGVNGKSLNKKVDYVFLGTTSNGTFASYDELIEVLVNNDYRMPYLGVANTSLQTYGRNTTGKKGEDYRRESVQFKIGNIAQEIRQIRTINTSNIGTLQGDWEEYALVSKLNKNKNMNSVLWSPIVANLGLTSLDNIYAVKVTKNVYSSVSNQHVKPKADVYLIESNISQQTMMECSYWLDEDMLDKMQQNAIKNSGISCKRPTSRNFTYMKFTISTFKTIFNDSVLGAGICIFNQRLSDLALNLNILSAWNISEKDFVDALIPFIGDFHINDITTSTEICTKIKHYCISKLKSTIMENNRIKDYIFKGIGAFEEPYTANFIYKDSCISLTDYPDFSITTGSGRHSGNYTICIVP